MDKSELLKLLGESGSRPLKGRSQNFLLDDSVVRRTADAAGISAGDAVVEVGPGLGALTSELLARGASVVAVELDPKLAGLLKGRIISENFSVVNADILEIPNGALLDRFEPRAESYKLVSNLPYSITSRFLEKFLLEEPRPVSITVMLQREVADRITAKPGSMSSLAVLVQALGSPELVVEVPPSAFYPSPKVSSAVVHIVLKSESELAQDFGDYPQDRLFSVVRAAFSHRRKKLRNTLRPYFYSDTEAENALISAKLSASARPEELSVADWLRLVKEIRK